MLARRGCRHCRSSPRLRHESVPSHLVRSTRPRSATPHHPHGCSTMRDWRRGSARSPVAHLEDRPPFWLLPAKPKTFRPGADRLWHQALDQSPRQQAPGAPPVRGRREARATRPRNAKPTGVRSSQACFWAGLLHSEFRADYPIFMRISIFTAQRRFKMSKAWSFWAEPSASAPKSRASKTVIPRPDRGARYR